MSPPCVSEIPDPDWSHLDRLILEVHSCETLVALEEFILQVLPGELGASFASWNEHSPELYLERVANSRSHEERIAPLVGALNESLSTHPLFPSYFNFETGKVIYSDSVDRTRAAVNDEAFYASKFFKNVAGELGIEDQLVMHVYVKGGRGILLTFHGEREFSDEEQLRAAVMRGHIIARLYTLQREAEKATAERGRVLAELTLVLSEREMQVLGEICSGASNADIAGSLDLSKRTVDKHVSNILDRLDLKSRYQLIAKYAHWLGFELGIKG